MAGDSSVAEVVVVLCLVGVVAMRSFVLLLDRGVLAEAGEGGSDEELKLDKEEREARSTNKDARTDARTSILLQNRGWARVNAPAS